MTRPFRLAAAFGALSPLMLAACATVPQSAGPATRPAPVVSRPTGPGAVGPLIGLDAKRLFADFGSPRLDIRERTVRKLQFGNGRCVLDAYLYAPAQGKEPVVTYVDARLPTGQDTDANGCAASLRK